MKKKLITFIFLLSLFSFSKSASKVETFISNLEIVGKKMVSAQWKYSNSNNAVSYSSAKEKKTANCARYVNYALQLSGFLQKSQSFYSNKNGKLVIGTAGLNFMKQKGIKQITYSGGKKIESAGLKKGDIVLWKLHTNVFNGIVNGKYTWYDGGKKSTDKTGSEGGTYIKYKRTGTTGFTSDNKVYGILRLS